MFLVVASLSCAAASSVGDRLAVRYWTQDAMPLDVTSAVQDGWALVGGTASCDTFYGHRYQLDGRLTPTLLFDNTGVLAGMQVLTNTSTFPLYPDTNLKAPLVQLIEDDLTAMTFYLMDPGKLCSAVAADHTEGSIGDRLWVRTDLTCNTAACFDVISLEEYDGMLDGLSSYQYAKGGCAPGMGTHYWGNISADVSCEDTGTLFLMYDRSKLVAFGIAYNGQDMQVPTMGGVRPDPTSSASISEPSRWEFAHQPQYNFLLDEATVSPCFENVNTFNESLPHGSITSATMHIFLSDPQVITCSASTTDPDPTEVNSASTTDPDPTEVNSTSSARTTDPSEVSAGSTITMTLRGVLFPVLATRVLFVFS
uniref:DOMON domain-containing protein n=1 Tax=Noctiluca scintillans TaxID=2966 RepID=A0A7S0ZLZ6_NOCSC